MKRKSALAFLEVNTVSAVCLRGYVTINSSHCRSMESSLEVSTLGNELSAPLECFPSFLLRIPRPGVSPSRIF